MSCCYCTPTGGKGTYHGHPRPLRHPAGSAPVSEHLSAASMVPRRSAARTYGISPLLDGPPAKNATQERSDGRTSSQPLGRHSLSNDDIILPLSRRRGNLNTCYPAVLQPVSVGAATLSGLPLTLPCYVCLPQCTTVQNAGVTGLCSALRAASWPLIISILRLQHVVTGVGGSPATPVLRATTMLQACRPSSR